MSDILITTEDGSQYLMHYGVMGMKWGVRNEETRRKYAGGSGRSSYPMSKRQAKRAIRKAKRSYRHETGKWGTTGKNVAAVTRKHKAAENSDEELKRHLANEKTAYKKIEKHNQSHRDLVKRADTTKDHLTRVQTDPNATREMRRSVEQRYLKERDAVKKSESRREKLNNEWEATQEAADKRRSQIAKAFIEPYKEAVVKDLNIDDVEAGKRMLEDYGLYSKALRWRSKRASVDLI